MFPVSLAVFFLLFTACDGASDPVESWDIEVSSSPLTVVDEWKLLALDGLGGDRFGRAVDLDGDYAIIGAERADSGGVFSSGAAYVYLFDGVDWKVQQRIVASDPTHNADFGMVVALSGSTAVVGAPGADGDEGAAYVFERSGTVWTETAKLNWFGIEKDGDDVDIDGDTLVVGAEKAAFVYIHEGLNWTLQAQLLPDDGPVAWFGRRIAIDRDTVIAGARGAEVQGYIWAGAAYVFVRSGTTWTEQQKLVSSNVATSDDFSWDVDVRGNLALIAEPGNWQGGLVHVFERAGSVWTHTIALQASDAVSSGQFGGKIALEGGVAVVGDNYIDDSSGSIYIFVQTGGVWTEELKYVPWDNAAHDRFSYAVGVHGNRAIAGAHLDDDMGSTSGSAYIIDWNQCAPGQFFVDGVCCNELCGNSDPSDCIACSIAAGGTADGTCTTFSLATTCRPKAGDCDLAETCDGVNLDCPEDTVQTAGTPCGDPTDDLCRNPDTCDGAGGCHANDEPDGTACGDLTDNQCTDPDTCDGAGSCLDNHEISGVPCNDGNMNTEDDVCQGDGACAGTPIDTDTGGDADVDTDVDTDMDTGSETDTDHESEAGDIPQPVESYSCSCRIPGPTRRTCPSGLLIALRDLLVGSWEHFSHK